MAGIRLVMHPQGVALLKSDPRVQAALGRWAAETVQRMKFHCPVSPVYPVYSRPGGSHRGGDFPLVPSGHLRRSIGAYAQPDGSIVVGPTASYGRYVNDGTRPHLIHSHGPWPLRSPATGQVFGPLVHHPGTRGAHFLEKTARDIDGEDFHIR